VNCDLNNSQTVECDLGKFAARSVSGKILTSAKIQDHNTFENPNTVMVKNFSGARLSGGMLSIQLPSKSVVQLVLQ
jgi:alpha-N-arabinofuranosidase